MESIAAARLADLAGLASSAAENARPAEDVKTAPDPGEIGAGS